MIIIYLLVSHVYIFNPTSIMMCVWLSWKPRVNLMVDHRCGQYGDDLDHVLFNQHCIR